MKQISIAIAGLLITLSSCEYEPHSVFERTLNSNTTAPDIETVNLDLSQDRDTVELLYNRVYFKFKSSNQEIRWIKFYLNDSLVGTVESEDSYFDLSYQFLYVGTHKLKLEIFTSSGTGSIADSLGAEGFLFASKEWIIKVNNTSYSFVTSTVSDGFLKLRWPKPYIDISEFIIYRSNYEIGRTANCEFIDKGYVGEGAEYYVRYKNNGELSTLGWVRIPNEIKFEFTYDTNNNYAINWGKLKYYAAVDSVIVLGNDGTYAPYEIDKTTDINRSSFEIPKSYFGQLRNYKMVLTPKYYNPLYNQSNRPYEFFDSPEIECMIGYPSPIFDSFMHLSRYEFLYHTNMYDHGNTIGNDSIFRYSALDNKIVDRFRYNPPNYSWSGDHYWNPTVSGDGSYFIATVGLTKTAIVNPAYSFKDYKIVDLISLNAYTNKIPISNIGTGIIISSDKKYLYDFENDSVLGYVSSTIQLSDYNISPDGKYFFLGYGSTIWLYSYINNKITPERTIDSPGFDYFNFVANESDKAVGWDKETKVFSILRCSDMAILKSFTVNEDAILDIDYYNERILSFSPKLLVVRSLDDGSELYKIPVSVTYIKKCCLTGNSIFHKEGARYFLN